MEIATYSDWDCLVSANLGGVINGVLPRILAHGDVLNRSRRVVTDVSFLIGAQMFTLRDIHRVPKPKVLITDAWIKFERHVPRQMEGSY